MGSDNCLSLQQCCDCCGLGLRVRAEGQSCESNPNLGYPCNHVMLSCCEGEEALIVPEVRRPPEPAAAPRRGLQELDEGAPVSQQVSSVHMGLGGPGASAMRVLADLLCGARLSAIMALPGGTGWD
ncbi:hypothetical protein P7K49_030700 [Saguinus oedipus]|uniref:Anaphylatoxin-like domain-containing protein n=1 Tax=Saguinus oedipus TaxID=9490 RepID=A0ABQ9U3M7_SAGOE|nr:hypothetical protein P7K49_030700 [Saguinus oedipus]